MLVAPPSWSDMPDNAPLRWRFLAEALTFGERLAARDSLHLTPCPDRPQRTDPVPRSSLARLYGITDDNALDTLLGHAAYLHEPLPPPWLASFQRLLSVLETAQTGTPPEIVVGQLGLGILQADRTATFTTAAEQDLVPQIGALVTRTAGAWLDADAGRQTVHQQLGLPVRASDPRSCRALLAALRNCPALARSMAERLDSTVRAIQEVLRRYHADAALIEQAWGSGSHGTVGAQIGRIRIALSDPHQGGRWVVFLRNGASGTSVFYKPRDLAADQLHAGIIELLRGDHAGLFAPPVQVLARDGYGWSRGLRNRDIATASVDDWRAYGAMAALGLVLNSADLGAANVVLSESGPVAIDSELWTSGIFFRSQSEREFAAGRLPIALRRAFPLARAGIAPFPRMVQGAIEDISASAALAQQPPHMAAAFTDGFGQAMRHIDRVRPQLQRMASEGQCELRFLYRDTTVYQKSLDGSWRAALSTFNIERSLYLATLAGATMMQGHPALARVELNSLENSDIPRVTVRYDGHSVYADGGQAVMTLDASPAQALHDSLLELPAHSPGNWSRRVAGALTRIETRTAAGRLQTVAAAVHHACCARLSDILFAPAPAPVAPHFYGGLLGLLVAVASGGCDGSDDVTGLVAAGVAHYCGLVQAAPCDSRFLASASLDAYGMSLLSRLGYSDPRFGTLVTGWTVNQQALERPDLVGGRAGHAVGALAMDGFLDRDTVIQLARQWLPDDERSALAGCDAGAGIAHGISGRALALGRFAAASGEAWAERACQSLMLRMQARLSESDQGAPGSRVPANWCAGMAGVGAVRIALARHLPQAANGQALRSLCSAIEAKGPLGIGDLCCGELGRLDFLLLAAQEMQDEDLGARTRAALDDLVRDVLADGTGRIAAPKEPWGLFKGVLGIAYLNRRIATDLAFPSIIALQ